MKQHSQEGMFSYKREVILVLRMKEIKENIKKATDSWNYILPAIKKGGADSVEFLCIWDEDQSVV